MIVITGYTVSCSAHSQSASQHKQKRLSRRERSVNIYVDSAFKHCHSRHQLTEVSSAVLCLPFPQTIYLHPAVLCCDLHLPPAEAEACCLHFFSRSLFQVSLGRPLPLCPCHVHFSPCLPMLSSLFLSDCPNQLYFLFPANSA